MLSDYVNHSRIKAGEIISLDKVLRLLVPKSLVLCKEMPFVSFLLVNKPDQVVIVLIDFLLLLESLF